MGYDNASFVGATSYSLTATFKEAASFHWSHVGLVYNYADDNNYDFMFIRHRDDHYWCGSVVSNSIVWHKNVVIYPTERYLKGDWNTLQVRVSDEKSNSAVNLNGFKTGDCPMRHPKSAKGGIWIVNGHQNIYRFREFNIEAVMP